MLEEGLETLQEVLQEMNRLSEPEADPDPPSPSGGPGDADSPDEPPSR